MSAVIDCLEFLTGGQRRWLLVHDPGALMREAEYAWTQQVEEATRFPDAVAERLKADIASLPLLPTDPPKPALFVRAVFGHYVEPEIPEVRPAPEKIAERTQRHRDAEATTIASFERHRLIEPHETYAETQRRLGEHDED